MGNLRLFIEDEFVDDVSENLLDVRLNFGLNADDQVVELTQSLLFKIDLEGVLVEISQDSLDKFVGLSADDVASGFSRW